MMSKAMLNNEKQTIYEIFRACRLCGAGGGYKMPIIQNVVNMDSVELRQKIRECVQIEVHPDDKMPPLICELCIDKVNDFYEFSEMCKQTNTRTRLRLGLPPQALPVGSEDCILGVTEPVFASHDSDDEPLRNTRTEKKAKKKPDTKLKPVARPAPPAPPAPRRRPPAPPAPRSPSPAPRRHTRQEPPQPLVELKPPVPESKSRSKTSTPKAEEKSVPVKRKQLPPAAPAAPASAKKPKARSPPPPAHKCGICGFTSTSASGVRTHQRAHTVTYTDVRLSCNACGEWFLTYDEARVHHRGHRGEPYHCTTCYGDFDTIQEYNGHFAAIPCRRWTEAPDQRCPSCWRDFPTRPLLGAHRCGGPDARPGGKCENCNRTYSLLKNLKKHVCTGKKRKPTSRPPATPRPRSPGPRSPGPRSPGPRALVPPALRARLQPLQVRVARCDPLLGTSTDTGHVDVGDIYGHWGTDLACYYPYKYNNSFTSELPYTAPAMVSIRDQVKQEFSSYVHWDSDCDEEQIKTVDKLSNLALKTIFSNKCLGKVPKRKKVPKEENLFGDTEDFTHNIDSIIDSLDDREVNSELCQVKSEVKSVCSLNVEANGSDSPVLSVFKTLEDVTNECGSPDITRDFFPSKGTNGIATQSMDSLNGVTENADVKEDDNKIAQINGIKPNDESEIDDKKLMDELDAQIGDLKQDSKDLDSVNNAEPNFDA